MKLPVIVVNFKAYESALGEAAVELAKVHEEVAFVSGVSIGVCVSALDMRNVAQALSIPVFAQHVDACNFGAHTGFLPALAVKQTGVFGTLLNHAEHKLSDEVLEATVRMCREMGLFTIVCVESLERALLVIAFEPDLIALEPPELIGGDVSVSTARPELIADVVKLLGQQKLLVGAGVKNQQDVRRALELGACGVLLASAVTKAADPRKVLLDLCSGFSVL